LRVTTFGRGREVPKPEPGISEDPTENSFPNSSKIEDGHPHRFRDTFAVEQLLSGTPIEEVSALLGHTSIKTTEESSAPWAHSRQKKLETSAKKSWADDPILKLLEGTPGVYKKLS